MVDSHFGQAEWAYVFASDGKSLKLLENRKVGENGGGCGCAYRAAQGPKASHLGGPKAEKPQGFIQQLVSSLSDVDAVVALRIGESPREMLKAAGIRAFTAMDSLERVALAAARRLEDTREEPREPKNASQSLALG
jgi:predicted Fe-Mo cluster-binding NifX family protein